MDRIISDRLKIVMQNLLLERPGNEKLEAVGKKKILDTRDMTILFRVCERTLYRWMAAGILAYRKISRRYYFLWIDVLPLLESNSAK